MKKIENNQRIAKITMKPTAYTKCEIGQDWYKNELEIIFQPRKCYPDYMEVNEWIMKNIDGQEMNIEDVVSRVWEYLANTYEPMVLIVRDYIKGCKTHFDVIVEK